MAPDRGSASSRQAVVALAIQVLRDSRIRTLGFAYLFAVYSFLQPYGYRKAYPSVASRMAFASTFGQNKGLRIFYGEPYSLLSVSGYTAWRVGGTLAIGAAVFGVLAAVRALRAEEEAGRMELVLSGALSRRAVYLAAMSAVLVEACVLFLAEFVGLLAGGISLAGAAYLALATSSCIPVFAGIGAVVGEIAPTRRSAREWGSAAVGILLLLRVVADTSSAYGWLRWSTPLGWAEELRPFVRSQPFVVVLPLVFAGILFSIPMATGRRRDIGSGLVRARDESKARLRLLSSTLAQGFRSERGSLLVWLVCVSSFGFILGVISESVSSSGIPTSLERTLAKLGVGSIMSPSGYLSFLFFLVILVCSLSACSQLAAGRREETEERLETLFALPVGRTRWLAGRVLLATGGTVLVALFAGVSTWLGAFSAGVHISFWRLLEAGGNCLPAAMLFLGVGVLAYGLVPRVSSAVAYGGIIATFLWQAVGSLLGAPHWLVDLTPFAWVGLVPSQAFRLLPAIVMVAMGGSAVLGGLWFFRRRDLLGA